ncbi:Alkanal monooxygenase alpha chain [Streptomyces hundungensis]|uniref:Alkanal monooxygenase alpha chain n=1 Tax=Streptomyces hundungensis TaxID=1077946 RepID=A0A387HEH6_9ACTN|nr:MupA/Atu3671 family FMN-dependent luciferase-like monooxygenase [Streptomyces hundungensis]AYG79097.1 Alkanal monooxygenase alpha chain [Streptomyces hundungensis]
MSDLSARLDALTPQQRRQLSAGLRAQRREQLKGPAELPDHLRRSLYFFASADHADASAYYAFVLEAAAAADAAGQHAVWFPERHFVDFGGFSPNPAVLAAAVAARTRTIGIRAGSVAAPLHHAARVAEDWAVVDGLSGGRVGLSFGSGWHPDDFALARTDYTDRRDVTVRTIEDIRALWRGETLPYPSTAGTITQVSTRPRPVQAELPVWLTATGTPQTFVAAATAGYGVATALLGQTLPALRDNIARYRQAWQDAGHPGEGDVVVMAHAYVSDRPDLEEFLRPAMHSYLRSFRKQTGDGDELVLLENAYLDFLTGPSLLGSPAKARSVLAELAAAGADEVGCLIDFGLPAADVLEALPALFDLGVLASERSA